MLERYYASLAMGQIWPRFSWFINFAIWYIYYILILIQPAKITFDAVKPLHYIGNHQKLLLSLNCVLYFTKLVGSVGFQHLNVIMIRVWFTLSCEAISPFKGYCLREFSLLFEIDQELHLRISRLGIGRLTWFSYLDITIYFSCLLTIERLNQKSSERSCSSVPA